MENLISTDWLNSNLDDKDLIILDASSLSNSNQIESQNDALQIFGARHFDLKNIFSDQESDLPNMLPSQDVFELECRALGINESSKIVVYDNLGIYQSPRVWWMFKTMGFQLVGVLDGGLPEWIDQSNPTEKIKKRTYALGDFKADLNKSFVKDFQYILTNTTESNSIVIDTRSAGRFNGTAPEPREGLRSGHIPNTLNIPFSDVLENGKYKSKEELLKVFNAQPLDNKPIIYSCGSGLTACIVLLASEMVLPNKTMLYDASWTEWAQLID
jgi:thiosulfate/3-mercaptopyruvate sulfurtransferase